MAWGVYQRSLEFLLFEAKAYHNYTSLKSNARAGIYLYEAQAYHNHKSAISFSYSDVYCHKAQAYRNQLHTFTFPKKVYKHKAKAY